MMFGLSSLVKHFIPAFRHIVARQKEAILGAEVERLIDDIADRRRQHKPTRSQQEQLRALRIEQLQRGIAR